MKYTRGFSAKKESNPTRSDARVEAKELVSFTGPITKIEDDRVQFHLATRYLEKDDYVQCQFAEKSDVLSLNKGESVTVYGNLAKVDTVVKFENCRLYGGS